MTSYRRTSRLSLILIAGFFLLCFVGGIAAAFWISNTWKENSSKNNQYKKSKVSSVQKKLSSDGRKEVSTEDDSAADATPFSDDQKTARTDDIQVKLPPPGARCRPRRVILGTTDNCESGRALKFLSKFAPAAGGLRRLAQGKIFPCEFDTAYVVSDLKMGDKVYFNVVDGGEGDFGPAQEDGIISSGMYIEAEVMEVSKSEDPKGMGVALARVRYLVWPVPQVSDLEYAIDVNGVFLRDQYQNLKEDPTATRSELESMMSGWGQVMGGTEWYFQGMGMARVLSDLSEAFLKDKKSAPCYLRGKIQADSPCFVRIDRTIEFGIPDPEQYRQK